jgi:hypothetical protein
MAAESRAPVATGQSVAESAALAQLRRGELTLDQYLDILVERNVQHIQSRVPAERLAAIKEVLREALVTNPGLVEVVRSLTGCEPRLPEDDLA